MKHLVIGMAVVVSMLVAPTAAHAQTSGRGPQYYLSLGDSLAAGIQPNAEGVIGPTDQGYADQLNGLLQFAAPGLQLVKLGCSGETTVTFTTGGICEYQSDQLISQTGDTGSQLSATLAFLAAHPGQVPLITIDLGAADLDVCIGLSSLAATEACIPPVLASVAKNLPPIVAELKTADPGAAIAGMNYYDGYLGVWLTGAAGEAAAKANLAITQDLNAAVTPAFQDNNVPFADVYDAFDSSDMTDMVTLPAPIGTVPKDVAEVCLLTWECTPPPQGPNKHPNAFGYLLIATTLLHAISGDLRDL